MASVVVESRPPLSSVTAGRGACGRPSDTPARAPDQDVQPWREPEAMAPAPLDDPWHEDLLLFAPHAQRHEQDALRGYPVSRLQREHLAEIALARHHELEPR